MNYRRFRVLLLLAVTLIFIMPNTARNQTSSPPARKSARPKNSPQTLPNSAPPVKTLSAANKQWVETTLRKMTDDEKIGQLIFATYHGSFTSTDADAYRKMMHNVNDLHVGGFINVTQMSPLGGVPGGGAGRISGSVFYDANDDGRREASERGAANVTVILDGRFAIRSDSEGRFDFPLVASGTHSIAVVPDNLALPYSIPGDGRWEVVVRTRETTPLEIAATKLP